jgi:hypothetical protein
VTTWERALLAGAIVVVVYLLHEIRNLLRDQTNRR